MLLCDVSTRILPSGLSPGVGSSCQVPCDLLGRAIGLPVLSAWLQLDFCLFAVQDACENRDLLEESGSGGDAVSVPSRGERIKGLS